MKKNMTVYSDNSITYWPFYEAGRIGVIYFLVIGIIFIAISLQTLSDNISKGTRLCIIVVIPVVVIALLVICSFIFRAMHKKIVVSNTGVEYSNKYTKSENKICWEEVSAVCFTQEHWYGRKSCKIFLKKKTFQKPQKNDKYDILLPVNSVDEQKLLQFIPEYLWKNNPYQKWT